MPAVRKASNGNTPRQIKSPKACESCRKKKVKCDGASTCGPCLMGDCECIYLTTRDRGAQNREQMYALQNRLNHVESFLSLLMPTLSKNVAAFLGESAPPYSVPQFSPLNSPTPKPLNLNHDVIITTSPSHSLDSVPTDQASPKVSATISANNDATDTQAVNEINTDLHLEIDGSGQFRYLGGGSNAVLAYAMKQLEGNNSEIKIPFFNATAMNVPDNSTDGIKKKTSHTVALALSKSEVSRLTLIYFDRVHEFFPILDRIEFFHRLENTSLVTGINDSPHDVAFTSLVFSVLACARAHDKDEESKSASLMYHETATTLQRSIIKEVILLHIQSLTLSAVFLAGANLLPSAWLLIGQAMRLAQDIGLHRSPTSPKITPLRKQEYRRVFWCIYGLDRVLSLVLGRPWGIDDQDITIELPLRVSDDALRNLSSGEEDSILPNTALSGMSCFIELSKLFQLAGQCSRVARFLDRGIDHNDPALVGRVRGFMGPVKDKLFRWCYNLSNEFKTATEDHPLYSYIVLIYMIYNSCIMEIHRPSHTRALEQPATIEPEIIEHWHHGPFSRTVQAALRNSRLGKKMKDKIPTSHLSAFACHNSVLSGLFLVQACPLYTDESSGALAIHGARLCSDSLATLEESWPGASQCRAILTKLISLQAHQWAWTTESNALWPSDKEIPEELEWDSSYKLAARCIPGEGRFVQRSPLVGSSTLSTSSMFPPTAPVLRTTETSEPQPSASDSSVLSELASLKRLFDDLPTTGFMSNSDIDFPMWESNSLENGDTMDDWFATFDFSGFPFPELKLFDTKNLKPSEMTQDFPAIDEDYIRQLELYNILGRELTAS